MSLAFDRWGEELCSHLEGDWALAAWDARERRLLLAVNACGNATLYYYQGKGFIAFASCLKALLALPGVPKEPDRLRLAQVLVSWQHDAELTAYKGFRRLLWAHAMTVASDGQTRSWRHWSPEGRDQLSYRRDEEYAEAFLESLHTGGSKLPANPEASGGGAFRWQGLRFSGGAGGAASCQPGVGLTAYTSVPCLPPDGAGKLREGNEWEMAHATAAMAGGNVRHIPIDAANYGVIRGIEHVLDAHDGPSHAAINHYWLQAIMETASESGTGALLTGQMGNGAISWEGNGSALLALLQGYPATALRLLLRAENSPWLMLKRQVLKPMLKPGLLALRRFMTPASKSWRSYSAINNRFASDLDLEGRMRAAGHDPNFTSSPLQDAHPGFFRSEFGIGPGIGRSWRPSILFAASIQPPTSLLSSFFFGFPTISFAEGRSSALIKRAFRNRLPDPVLQVERKGLQAADAGHRILRELPAFRECLTSLDSLPEANEILDMPLLHRCLDDLVAKVDPGTTARAGMILLRGLGVGLFLRRLADSGT